MLPIEGRCGTFLLAVEYVALVPLVLEIDRWQANYSFWSTDIAPNEVLATMAEPSSKKRRMEVVQPLSVAMSGLARHQVTLPETLSPGGVHGCRVAVAVSPPAARPRQAHPPLPLLASRFLYP